MPVSVKIGGVWKTATAVFNKVGGAWKTASDMPVKIGGVWKTGILASNSFESIATVTLASPTATVSFSSIAGTYKSLQIRLMAKTAGASVESMDMKLNGVSTSSYFTHYLNGNGTSAGASGLGPFTSIRPLYSSLAPTGSSGFSGAIIDIIDYASTSKNKTIMTIGGYDNNGSGNIGLVSGLYFANTNAITSIAFTNGSGNFVTGSTFALYGIKGA